MVMVSRSQVDGDDGVTLGLSVDNIPSGLSNSVDDDNSVMHRKESVEDVKREQRKNSEKLEDELTLDSDED